MLAMISTNALVQLLTMLAQYKKKSWATKLKEGLITVLFLNPSLRSDWGAIASIFVSGE